MCLQMTRTCMLSDHVRFLINISIVRDRDKRLLPISINSEK